MDWKEFYAECNTDSVYFRRVIGVGKSVMARYECYYNPDGTKNSVAWDRYYPMETALDRYIGRCVALVIDQHVDFENNHYHQWKDDRKLRAYLEKFQKHQELFKSVWP